MQFSCTYLLCQGSIGNQDLLDHTKRPIPHNSHNAVVIPFPELVAREDFWILQKGKLNYVPEILISCEVLPINNIEMPKFCHSDSAGNQVFQG